ncbi:bifunctional aminoglycoside phosphotransferase/ATP-binding protein [Sphingobium cloacae]|uniref:Aminoglycoside phosphotransferase n=1 Tax=Sphingobium cloacae TaxID=120107 RepID=A0A1E1EYF7_9SPHN|nr:bifunctional aminoglycoside phosphotransferase/ATP-binding protein [Sphingobium cloacae]BAV63242.1 aminoglycoside phosphotransferase [Sphingobium cloacae]
MADHADKSASDLDGWLSRGNAFGSSGPVRRIDTHAASIFLSGDTAWKIKRPVDLGYLDFSTPEKRRTALEAELALNRRTAPSLYTAVHPITRDKAGLLAIDGDGKAIDWILEMRRFPDGALWSELADRDALDQTALQQLADSLVDFHSRAQIVWPGDGAARMRQIIAGNAEAMGNFSDILEPNAAIELTERLSALVDHNSELLDARGKAGHIRHVHGDLHLANIAMIDGVPTPFDCLEFDTELATTDVLYDLAFLLMDLWQRGLRSQANMVFNRYLDQSPEDEGAIGLMPLFMSVRASIRAHVAAVRAKRGGDAARAGKEAVHYLELAGSLIAEKRPRLIAIGGLSGTGKSTLARTLGAFFGRPPGARILRSDILRKRLAGVSSETPLPASSYSAEASAAVYVTLGGLAQRDLTAGHAVIADAVFGIPDEREAIAEVARRAGCAFAGLWLELPELQRIARVDRRISDASDANAEIVRAQSQKLTGKPANWDILISEGLLADLSRKARALLGLKPGGDD